MSCRYRAAQFRFQALSGPDKLYSVECRRGL
jgi:hypothetical protein